MASIKNLPRQVENAVQYAIGIPMTRSRIIVAKESRALTQTAVQSIRSRSRKEKPVALQDLVSGRALQECAEGSGRGGMERPVQNRSALLDARVGVNRHDRVTAAAGDGGS